MSRPKIGDRVKIISDCMTNGCTGEVKEVYDFFSEVTVKLDKRPFGYRGNVTVCYNMKSVEVLPKEKSECEGGGTELNVGVFFIDDLDLKYFKDNHVYLDTDAIVVMGNSVSDCAKVLNELIEDGETDEDTYSYLYFKGEVYKVIPPKQYITVEKA